MVIFNLIPALVEAAYIATTPSAWKRA